MKKLGKRNAYSKNTFESFCWCVCGSGCADCHFSWVENMKNVLYAEEDTFLKDVTKTSDYAIPVK